MAKQLQLRTAKAVKKKRKGKPFFYYLPLIASSFLMLLPFLWMLSSSLKTDIEVFQFPIQWNN